MTRGFDSAGSSLTALLTQGEPTLQYSTGCLEENFNAAVPSFSQALCKLPQRDE
jgi:hypothetical protein